MCVKLEADHRLWLFLGTFACAYAIIGMFQSCSYLLWIRHYRGAVYALDMSCVAMHYIIQLYVHIVCRHMHRPAIGRFRKAAIEVVTVCAALALRETTRNDVPLLISLISITLDLHIFAQLSKATPDIGLLDVLLGLFMQVIVYETSKEMFATVEVIALCSIVIMYRCWSYSPPDERLVESKKVDGDGAC